MKVSIITVCRNAEATIEATLQSTLNQDCKNIELIVIDGQSSDNTLKVINQFRTKITQFVSEKDKGIYDAMNKGITLASGDIIFFLNANDTFADKTVVSRVVDFFRETDAELVYGNIKATDNGKPSIIKFDRVNPWFLMDRTVCHQAIFAQKSLFDKYGTFDLKYKLAADYDWLLRSLIKHKAKAYYLDLIMTNFSMTGVSNDHQKRNIVLAESKEIQGKYFFPIELILRRTVNALVYFGAKAIRPIRGISS